MVSPDLFFTEKFAGNGPILAFEASHTVLSVGMSTNVPDFAEGVYFVTNSDEN